MTPDPSAPLDDSLDVLRGLGRTMVGICAFLVLAGATLVVGHGASESFMSRCVHAAEASEGFDSVGYDTRWFPPRLVCTFTNGEGQERSTTLPISTYGLVVLGGLAAAWTVAAGFALAVAVRPQRIGLLDRAASTWLLGMATGLTLVQIVVSLGRRSTEYASAGLGGRGYPSQPEWLFPCVVGAVITGAVIAAARAHRPAGGWAAALATALGLGLYLIITAVIHPLRLSPGGAVAAGLAAGASVHVGRAVRRLRHGPVEAADR